MSSLLLAFKRTVPQRHGLVLLQQAGSRSGIHSAATANMAFNGSRFLPVVSATPGDLSVKGIYARRMSTIPASSTRIVPVWPAESKILAMQTWLQSNVSLSGHLSPPSDVVSFFIIFFF